MTRDDSVATAKEKLERSLAIKTKLKEGDRVKEEDLHMISPGNGYKWQDKNKFIDRMANREIEPNTLITDGLFY